MKKLFVLFAVAFFSVVHADEQFLGLYMNGSKIGYSSYTSHPEMLGTERVSRSDSTTMMDTKLLGAELKMTIEGTTWTNSAGSPVKMLFTVSSAGRVQKVVAIFNSQTVELDIDNQGAKAHRSLPLPPGGTVVDDPLELFVGDKVTPGFRKTVYVLDPTTVSFLKTDVILVGPRTTTVRNQSVQANLVQVVDPRLTTDVYVSAKGDFVKAETTALGIEMIPESREEALNNKSSGYKPSADLAFSSSIHADKSIDNPATISGLTLRITGKDLSSLPSDEHQTVTKKDGSWTVDIHPPALQIKSQTKIATAGQAKPDWVKPSLNIPSDSPDFETLAASIVQNETRVIPAALSIKAWVNKSMHPNAGIGVLRDAGEILSTKEGVCRDYAILTATLMRAAGIPARLASGVVNWQGSFYYHAWVEVWDGNKWIGIDSTVPEKQLSAAHVKLADGNVEEAFAFTFLEKVKIEVLDVRRGK